MRIQTVLITASALTLAACGSPGGDADTDGDGVVSADEAEALSNAAGDDIKPLPGNYKVETTFVKAEGLPKEMLDMMSASMGNSMEFCLTPEMAAEGFGQRPDQEDDGCTMEKYVIDGNNMDMAMSCTAPDGSGPMTMGMSGTVSPTESDLVMTSKGMIPGMDDASIEMRVQQTRIGDCEE
ncbi:DUF3617 domain-containing protein [Erythrobacter sp. F6033]|uniref:DUF3617 domain-containing protein n=1 Tax=Erythrobacter sp. F6033 TaxID=2926401 RepID=UPI001FF3A322|nr:DUF3617 domain-containing protein [Erythrobacter sp. F6033]MCK0127798.1 DUF3617 domain-containing protein [Erythrobacter sp. F6033]